MEPAPASEPMSEPLSEPMQQVIEALLAGAPAPPSAQSALTDREKAEVAALSRTARLAKLVVAKSDPPAGAEEAARQRAQTALTARASSLSSTVLPEKPVSRLRAWWDRLRKRSD